jgi:hypothetical protein
MTSTLIEQIKILVEFQKIDAEVYRLKKELSFIPESRKKIEQDFDKKKVGLKAAEDALKARQLEQKNKELELLEKEDKIKKLQSQLYQLKSNKEYAAMDLEIKGLRADKSLLEEDILTLLDTVDQAKAKCVAEKEALAVEEKKSKEEVDILNKRAAELQAMIAELEENRKKYVPNAEPRLLSQYERVLKGRDGLALVPVVNGSCGGCHMELPAQTVNEVQLHEKLIVCESCARMLYWPS